VRRDPVPNGVSVRSLASGFAVFVFMAPASLRGPGQHIGKTPGVPLIPRATGSGTSRISSSSATEAGLVHPDDELEQARRHGWG
jgi:hypothetical protein